MTIAELQKKLNSNGITVKKADINYSYVFKLSNGATILVAYRNDVFKNIQVTGSEKCEQEIIDILGGGYVRKRL